MKFTTCITVFISERIHHFSTVSYFFFDNLCLLEYTIFANVCNRGTSALLVEHLHEVTIAHRA